MVNATALSSQAVCVPDCSVEFLWVLHWPTWYPNQNLCFKCVVAHSLAALTPSREFGAIMKDPSMIVGISRWHDSQINTLMRLRASGATLLV